MATVIEVTGYTPSELEELSSTAYERAYSWWYGGQGDYEWWDCTIDDFCEKMETLGVTITPRRNSGRKPAPPAVYFSGFSSQGDGASFEADIDLAKWCKANQTGRCYRAALYAIRHGYLSDTASIHTSGHYSHSGTMHLDEDWSSWEDEATDKAILQHATLREHVLEWCRDKADDLYRDLEKEYEYLTSEEQFIESCEVNGYLFDEYGRII